MLQQAHFDGVIDLAEARPRDRRWNRRLRWAMEHVERRNLQEVLRLHHALHASAVTYLAGDKPLQLHWKQANKLQSQIENLLFPWSQGQRQEAYRNSQDIWEKAYGKKLSDPETQSQIDNAVKKLMSRTKRNREAQAGFTPRKRNASRKPIRSAARKQ